LSNLVKAGWFVVDRDDTRVIDNNELANQRIEAFQEKELERRREEMAQAVAGGEFEEFAEGLNAEQLDQLMSDQAIYGATGQMPEELMAGQQQQQSEFDDPEYDAEEIQRQIDEQLEQARQQAEAILADAQEQVEQIKASAMEEGHQQGYNDGYAQGVQEAEMLKTEVEEQRAGLDSEYQQLVDALEPEMVDVLTQIYEHVFGIEFKDDKNIILHLLRNTLSRVEPGKDFLVHVSPDDYDMFIDEKDRLQESVTSPNATMEIVEDSMLKQNECMVETDGGVFDCSVGVELEEISRKLKLLSFDRKKR